MKNNFLMLTIIGFILLQPKISIGSYFGYFSYVKGGIIITSQNNSNQSKSARKNMLFDHQIVVNSNQDSEAILAFNDGSLIKIFPNSQLEVNEISSPTANNRSFYIDIELNFGTISVYVSRLIQSFNTKVNTYVITPPIDSCFSASNYPERSLIRFKAADKPIDISEGLSEEKINKNKLFVRYEQAFAFTSKYIIDFEDQLMVKNDKLNNGVITYSIQLVSKTNNNQIINYPIQALGTPLNIFPGIGEVLDDQGYLFFDANLKNDQISSLSQITYCFDINDAEKLFDYSTGVIRQGKSIN